MIFLLEMGMLRTMLFMARKPRADKASDTEQVNLRITTKLLDQLDQIGERTGLRRSHLIQHAIFEFVQRQSQQHQPIDRLPSKR